MNSKSRSFNSNTLAAVSASLVVLFCSASTCEGVLVTINEPLIGLPAFAVTPGHTVDYLPVEDVNTTIPQNGFPQPNTDVQSDDKWGISSNYGGTGEFVMTSRHAFEDSPEIAITVGDLANDDYNVFVQTFVNAASDVYGGRYGFESGVLTTFFSSDGGDVLVTGIDGPKGQGQFQIREFFLGTQNVSSGDLTVYVEDFDQQSLVGTFVALRLEVVPEPTTFALTALGIMGLLVFGRPRRHRAA